jgi:hypothetical protein
MDNNEKRFVNFDDFCNATESVKPVKSVKPEKPHEFIESDDDRFSAENINRDDCGKLPTTVDCVNKVNQPEFLSDECSRLGQLFPRMCIDWETVRVYCKYPVDLYERVMGLGMFITVFAALNPALLLIMAFTPGGDFSNMYRLSLVFAMIIFFIVSAFGGKGTFWLPMLGAFALVKLIFFPEAAADAFISMASMLIVVLVFNRKKGRN